MSVNPGLHSINEVLVVGGLGPASVWLVVCGFTFILLQAPVDTFHADAEDTCPDCPGPPGL